MNPFLDSAATAARLIAGGDPRLLKIVALSLGVSALACVIASAAGMLAGAALAVWRFPGRRAVLVLLNTLLALPSVVVGLVVYMLLSRAGPLGLARVFSSRPPPWWWPSRSSSPPSSPRWRARSSRMR